MVTKFKEGVIWTDTRVVPADDMPWTAPSGTTSHPQVGRTITLLDAGSVGLSLMYSELMALQERFQEIQERWTAAAEDEAAQEALKPDLMKIQRQLMAATREVMTEVADLIAKWAPLLGVSVGRVFVQQMKTKWGSCNPHAYTIRLNTELAKKPKECLEYIVVHELVHLLEPTHNARFMALMDQYVPKWKFFRQQLNRLPVRHADWGF